MSKAIETTVAKFAVAFVAVAMLFSLVAPAANAQTTDELQQMINDLLAQVSALQGDLGGDTMSAAGVCPYTWTRSLGQGSSGMDVMMLQKFLNADPDTVVSLSGVGSPGMETEYYGALTAAAVSKMQVKYRSQVLTPVGLVNPTGYFGPSSMSAANGLCVAAPVDPVDEEEGTDEEEEEMEDDSLSGGETSLESFEGSDGDDTDLEEGQVNAPVAEFEFDVEDGDIRISRMDIVFDETGGAGADTEPWDTFETVSLWVDGDMIAEMDVDNEDDWNDDDPSSGLDRIRFTGLDQIFREDDTANITVGVTVQGSVDGITSAVDAEWTIYVPTDGIRGRDSASIDQYTGATGETVDFTIEEEGGEDELKIGSSTSDPESTTLPVEESSNSDWFTVFAFDMDTDDSTNDIEVDTMVVSVQTGAANYEDVVNDAMLVIGGEEFDDFTVSGEATTYAVLTFDIDKDLAIDAGDEVTAELQLEFKKLTGNYAEGETVTATTTATGWAAEGADDLTVGTQLDGAATGDEHTLRTEGVILDFVSSTESLKVNSDTTTADDEGVFTIKVDVTAFETDIWVNKNAASGTAFVAANGVNFSVEDTNGDAVSLGTSTASLTSTADTDGTRFLVSEGETETFTLTVNYDPATSGFYQVQFYSINAGTSNANAASGDRQLATPFSDYESGTLSI